MIRRPPVAASLLALLGAVAVAACSEGADDSGPAPTGLAASGAPDAIAVDGSVTTSEPAGSVGSAAGTDSPVTAGGDSPASGRQTESTAPSPVADEPAGLILIPGTSGAFTSPSGNIACSLTETGGASCYIIDKQWTIDEPEGCAGLDYGNALEVGPTGSAYSCYTDFSWDTTAAALPYGSAMAVGEVLCESERTGITCSHSSGAGFTVARAVSELF